jgi:hypothetical protein
MAWLTYCCAEEKIVIRALLATALVLVLCADIAGRSEAHDRDGHMCKDENCPIVDASIPPSIPPKPLLSCSPDGSIIVSPGMQPLFSDPKLGTLAWSYAVKACAVPAHASTP